MPKSTTLEFFEAEAGLEANILWVPETEAEAEAGFQPGMEVFGKSWWGKMPYLPIAFLGLAKIRHLYHSKPFEIEDVVDIIHPEVIQH